MRDELAKALKLYQGKGKGKQDAIPLRQNQNIDFKGPSFLNRSNAVPEGCLGNWIKTLASRGGVLADRPLATYTLPGAHDAMTFAFKGSFFTRNIATFVRGGTVTQTLNLVDQFKAGIRYFDIRVKEVKGKLYGFHGKITFTHHDARQELRRLFIIASCRKEPIVIKFVYSGNAFPIVKEVANSFAKNLMPTKDYWHKGVEECINQGKVICIFHKAKDKHRLKWGNVVDTFEDYGLHKKGGFSNKHSLKSHKKYLAKMVATVPTENEEMLKIMSLNIPCVQTGAKNLLKNVPGLLIEGLVVVASGSLIRPGGQIHHMSNLLRVPQKKRWLGFYKSVKDIEKHEGVKEINREFALKLNNLVNAWYFSLYQRAYGVKSALPMADDIMGKVSGVVGMDYVGDKGALIKALIEVNNRDF